jgi:hypothetical protein
MKPIKGFKNYSITKNGQVFGAYGIIAPIHGIYLSVTIYKNKKRYQKYIHQLVLETFIGPRPNKMEANHKDGNKHNPKLKNLEWITKSKNAQHAIAIGLKTIGKPNAKLKPEEVWLIKKLLKTKIVTQTLISKIFKVHKTTISDIKHQRKWINI